MCRFTPRRRRLVTSSRPPVPRVHARQTPLNFYSILLSPSSYSSIPFPSLPRQIIYFSSTKLPRSRANTLSVLLTESSTTNYHLFLFPLSSTKLSLASTSYSRSPTLDRHSWYHQRRVILSDNISEHTNNLFPFLFPRSFLSFLFYPRPCARSSVPTGEGSTRTRWNERRKRKLTGRRKWRGTGHSHSTHLNGV